MCIYARINRHGLEIRNLMGIVKILLNIIEACVRGEMIKDLVR